MKHRVTLACLALSSLFFSACSTRSISDSSYEAAYGHSRYAPAPASRELSEFDVLGIDPDQRVTEAEIGAALTAHNRPRLTPDKRIVLIQSGADYPDAPMLEGLRATFSVEAFTGRAPGDESLARGASYARTLRLAAARGGFDTIVCYWGVLESERTANGSTKFVSWVPVVGDVLPDEREAMRIRLKAAIIDVASGQWTLVTPPAFSTSQLSTFYSRKKRYQAMVAELKVKGYAALVEALARPSLTAASAVSTVNVATK